MQVIQPAAVSPISAQLVSALGSRIVSQSYMGHGNQLSNGTDLSTTYRTPFVFPKTSFNIQLIFANFFHTNTGVGKPGNAVTVTAALEYAGFYTQVRFGGQGSASIPDGSYAISDPINVDIAAGATAYVRACPSVTSGGKWVMSHLGVAGGTYSAAGSDLTQATGALANIAANQALMKQVFAPVAILGSVDGGKSGAVAIIGDSISNGEYGYGDATPTRDWLAHGFITRGLGKDSAWLHQGVPQSTAATRATDKYFPLFNKFYSFADYAICSLGVNDLPGTLITVEANLVAIWQKMARRGVKIWQTTITPNTTSTDSWATAANQTPTSKETNRVLLNRWIRDGAPVDSTFTPVGIGTAGYRAGSPQHPLSGWLEIADTVEVDATGAYVQDGGRWACGGVSDTGTLSAYAGYAATDSTKSWGVNAHAGKNLVVTGGTGSGQKTNITSNTATTANIWMISTGLDATSTYSIIDTATYDGLHPSMNGHIAMSAPVAAWVKTLG